MIRLPIDTQKEIAALLQELIEKDYDAVKTSAIEKYQRILLY